MSLKVFLYIVLIIVAILFVQAFIEYSRPKAAPEYEEFGDYFK